MAIQILKQKITAMKLTSRNVEQIFVGCLFQRDEDTANALTITGTKMKVCFNPAKLEEHRQDIIDMMQCLPAKFHGPGASFLDMCMDKHDILWTGSHIYMDNLLCLGLAVDRVEMMEPRANTPYFKIK